MEKNVLLTTRRGDEVMVIRPYTSVNNVKGLTDYIQNVIGYVKNNFVHKEAGKGLSTNDFTNDYVDKIDILAASGVTKIIINGEKIDNIDGTVDITNYTITADNAMSGEEITEIFNKGEN